MSSGTTGTPGMTNWKNVNNWHWTEKNCFPWSKAYLQKSLKGVKVSSAKNPKVWVSTTEVSEVAGDVDLHQRKGKIITLFDLVLQIKWEGETATGQAVTGRIDIPEVAHDSDLDDYVFDTTINGESRDTEEIRHLIRSDLTKVLRTRLSGFSKALIDAHGKDVHIPEEELRRSTAASSGTVTPAEVPTLKGAEAIRTEEEKGKALSTTTIEESVEFTCSADDLFAALMDEGRARIWTRGAASVTPTVGTEFRFFDGNVSGKILSVTPGKEVKQTWRLKTWPAGHFSTVTLTLEQQSSSTTLRLLQTGVPVGEQDATKQNWRHYYFNGIKQAFGYVELIPGERYEETGAKPGGGGRSRKRSRGRRTRKGTAQPEAGSVLAWTGMGVAMAVGLGYLLTYIRP